MGATTVIYDVLKDVVALATGSNDLALKNKVLELQTEFIKMTDENRQLRDKIIELENNKQLEDNLEFHIDYYLRKTDKRIFCKQCWEDEHKLISLEALDSYGTNMNYCRRCKSRYYKGYQDSQNRLNQE